MNAKKELTELMMFIRCKFPESLNDEEANALLPVYHFNIKQELEAFESLKNKIEKEKTRLRIEINLAKYHKNKQRECYLQAQLDILEKVSKNE